MKAIAVIAVLLLAIGAVFGAGYWVGQNSKDAPASVAWRGTSETNSVLTKNDNRPFLTVPDGGTGSIDDWDVTASFCDTTAPYGYGKRRVDFDVRVEWTGEDAPGELMRYNFLESAMVFISPSGKTATAHLQGDYSDGFDGIAYNGSNSLPDEPGTFVLIFAPHPQKHRLVWSVDLPYLP